MTPEERFTRIETNLERLEAWMERSIHAHDLRIQKLTDFQTVLMETQNDTWRAQQETWRALKSLSENIERLIRGQGPNGAP